MDDSDIIALYERRSERAIAETSQKYGPYCTGIAWRILACHEDAEECVSDTWLNTWQAIPPARPRSLKAFVGRITHNLALNRCRYSRAQKRGVFTEVLEELEIPALEDPCGELERRELAAAISRFLRGLPEWKRQVFLLRYWEYQPLKTIGEKTGLKEDRVATELYRLRKKLKTYLEQEGFVL